MKDKVEISVQLLQGILNYLATKPYAEVAQIIGAVQAEAGPQLQAPTEDA